MKTFSLKELLAEMIDSAWLVLIVIGMISVILGAGGNFQVGSFSLQGINGTGSIIFWGIGGILIVSGIVVLGLNLRNNISLIGNIEETYECEGMLYDLLLIDDLYENKDIKTMPMPAQRIWDYKLSSVLIKQYSRKLNLTYTVQLQRPDGSNMETYESTGSGPYIDGIAYLQYKYKPKINTKSSWNGVMILQIPRRDEIKGIWLTTNIKADRRFPIGVISLKRKD